MAGELPESPSGSCAAPTAVQSTAPAGRLLGKARGENKPKLMQNEQLGLGSTEGS